MTTARFQLFNMQSLVKGSLLVLIARI